jgi:polysaccharide deacetylase 2 family uncharacterized protein YibQ
VPLGPPSTRLRRRVVSRVPAGSCRYGPSVAGGLALALSLGMAQTALAQSVVDAPGELPAISIIIDDLGYRRLDGLRAIELPGPIAYAILPHTPYATRLAGIAFQLDKEVLLHVPMQSNVVDKALGPGALTNGMSRREIQAVLEAGLASVPHVSGINNHMGSALTRNALPMGWLMEWMSTSGDLYFVDSLTSSESVALRTAHDTGLRAIGRDVFLDPTPDADAAVVRRQFQRLIEIARNRGTGLAIGHPYPQTLGVLRQVLLKPSHYGVQLVPVHELIARRATALQSASRPSQITTQRTAYSGNSAIGNRRAGSVAVPR